MKNLLLDRYISSVQNAHLGDCIGSAHEFGGPDDSRQMVPLAGGPFPWRLGEGTDDSDLTEFVLEALASSHTVKSATANFRGRLIEWADAGPPDIGNQTQVACRALKTGQAVPQISEGNGSLMRMSPIAVVADLGDRQRLAYEIGSLTHPAKRCVVACSWYVEVLHSLLTGTTRSWAVAHADLAVSQVVMAEIRDKPLGVLDGDHQGHVILAAAITRQVMLQREPWDGLRRVLQLGGDTDTNLTIAMAAHGAAKDTSTPPALLAQCERSDRFEALARAAHGNWGR